MKYLKLEDDLGNVYNFPPSFWIYDDSMGKRSNVKNLAYAHGGKNISDGFIDPRNLVIEGEIRADTEAEFEVAKFDLMQAVLKGGKLSVYDDIIDRFIYVKYSRITSTYTGEYVLEKPYSIIFVVEYPFWQDETEIEEENIVSGNDTLYIDNTNSLLEVSPIIEIEADQGADLPSIRMRNQSDGGMEFQYNNPDFFAGSLLVIDCFNGTVTLNNNNSAEFFNPARFLRLLAVNNQILYEGNACTIRFKYRGVYP